MGLNLKKGSHPWAVSILDKLHNVVTRLNAITDTKWMMLEDSAYSDTYTGSIRVSIKNLDSLILNKQKNWANNIQLKVNKMVDSIELSGLEPEEKRRITDNYVVTHPYYGSYGWEVKIKNEWETFTIEFVPYLSEEGKDKSYYNIRSHVGNILADHMNTIGDVIDTLYKKMHGA